MSFLTAIFAPGEQERGDELDRRRLELDRQALERGRITQQEYARREAQVAEQRVDVGAELNASFKEGAQEGYQNVTGGLRAALAAPFKFIFDALPWQAFVALAVALFLYLGGGVWLKGIIARKMK